MSIWVVAIIFHAALIALAYWIGERHAGRGVALVLVGAIGFQVVVNGLDSFTESSGCRYSQIAQDC